MSNTAGVDDNQVGLLGGLKFMQSEPLEQLPNLLALILINFTAKGIYGKSHHNLKITVTN